MRSARTKIVILVVLVAIWAAVVFLRQPGEPPVRTGPTQPDARVPRPPARSGTTPMLRTDLLRVARAPYPADVQNIFSAPPPPPVKSAEPSALATAPSLPPPDPFQEEAKQFRYVGFLRSGSANTAFIIRGQEVHTVPVGAMLGERFRVADVQDDGVVLTSPAGDKQVRLSLAADSSMTGPRALGAPDGMAPPRPPGAPR
jgi:hypothetical protein